MKQYIIQLLNFIASLVFVIACSDMNAIQSKYADQEEQVYLGRVDSLKSFPGFGRAKVTWYIGADPRIEKTIIYWNMRKDSIVKNFVRITPGLQKDSIILENLQEGNTFFEFRNVNSKGESSLYSSLSITSWGALFSENLPKRKVVQKIYDYETESFQLTISPVIKGDSIVYAKFVYTDTNGKEQIKRIERDDNSLVLLNFPDGGEFKLQMVYFLPQGIDTVYGQYESFFAPKVTFEQGEKLSIGGGLGSRYFERNGKNLYEWNSSGDIIVYRLEEDNSFTQVNLFESLVPRSAYREFFFYDDVKFISIDNNYNMRVQEIQDGKLSEVGNLGGGWTESIPFIPAKGFFLTYDSHNLTAWPARNDGSWAGGGYKVASGVTYNPFTLYKYQTFLGVDENGFLWAIPITSTGFPLSISKIGQGWDKFKKIVPVGDIVLAMDEEGFFWKFNFDTNYYWIVE